MFIAHFHKSVFWGVVSQIAKTIFKTNDHIKAFVFSNDRGSNNANEAEYISSHIERENLWFFIIPFSFRINVEIKGTTSLNMSLSSISLFIIILLNLFRISHEDGDHFSCLYF